MTVLFLERSRQFYVSAYQNSSYTIKTKFYLLKCRIVFAVKRPMFNSETQMIYLKGFSISAQDFKVK